MNKLKCPFKKRVASFSNFAAPWSSVLWLASCSSPVHCGVENLKEERKQGHSVPEMVSNAGMGTN